MNMIHEILVVSALSAFAGLLTHMTNNGMKVKLPRLKTDGRNGAKTLEMGVLGDMLFGIAAGVVAYSTIYADLELGKKLGMATGTAYAGKMFLDKVSSLPQPANESNK